MKFIPSKKQLNIINHKFNLDHFSYIFIDACSGSGQIKTLMERANTNPNERYLNLYLSEMDASIGADKFKSSNVTCRSIYHLAKRRLEDTHSIGVKLKDTSLLVDHIDHHDIKRLLGIGSAAIAKVVLDAFNAFLYSQDDKPSKCHVNLSSGIQSADYLKHILEYVNLAWEFSITPMNSFPMTKESYFKLYSLQHSELSRWFNVIIFDGENNFSDAIYCWLRRQNCNLIINGNSHLNSQNNENERCGFAGGKVYKLDESYCYGHGIASLINKIIKKKQSISGVKLSLISGCDSVQDSVFYTEESPPKEGSTFIFKNAISAIKMAFASSDKNIYWIGGIEEYKLNILQDIAQLRARNTGEIPCDSVVKSYRTYADLKGEIEDNTAHELKEWHDLFLMYESEILIKTSDLICSSAVNIEASTTVIATIKTAKEKKFNSVVLGGDFSPPCSSALDVNSLNSELNALYMAVTRARKSIYISYRFANFFK